MRDRAQPEEGATLVEDALPAKTDVRNRMIRYPLWLDPLIKEAAEREGLSANAWIMRCLAEGAQRSQLYGWETSSISTTPSKPDAPEGRAPLGGRARITETIAQEGKLTLHTGTYPTPENTVTWTRLVTGDGYPVEEFAPPDEDIPSL